jgi:ABC-2 type transport system ATP-binding protein
MGPAKPPPLRIILDILVPDSGTVTWQNEMIDEKMLNYIGYLPEERGLYQDQNVFDVLMYTAAIKNVGRTKAKVDIVRHLDRFDMVEMADPENRHFISGQPAKGATPRSHHPQPAFGHTR